MDDRYGRVKWGVGQERQRTSADYWKQPLKWNHKGKVTGTRTKVFCASLADWLDHEVPIEWLADLIALIDQTPNLDWLLLTKRIEQFSDRLHDVVRSNHDGADTISSYWLDGDYPKNVWLGTTVENQKAANDRIPLLLKAPAATRFLSCEPLLEQIDLEDIVTGDANSVGGEGHFNCLSLEEYEPEDDEEYGGRLINWVICGGESGAGARPFDLQWARSLRSQCQVAGVAYFFKQAGSNAIDSSISSDKLKLKDKKGGDISEMPSELQVREFPVSDREVNHV